MKKAMRAVAFLVVMMSMVAFVAGCKEKPAEKPADHPAKTAPKDHPAH